MERINLLLIDDDSDLVLSLSKALKAAGCEHHINGATRSEQALALFLQNRPAVCVLDMCLRESGGSRDGLFLLKQFLQYDPTVRIIILTGNGSNEIGVEALNSGAASFLQKPADIPHLLALIRDGINQCELRRSLTEGRAPVEARIADLIIARSEAMKPVLDSVYQASQTHQPVLITGETGTGKGLCASAIHQAGKRRHGNFVRYQPTHTSLDLVMSDLFGHNKGAYTGADKERDGLIKNANGGTLFLDEVDELPHGAQVSLLGVLQDKLYRPLGSSTDFLSDFRLISATNRDPTKMVESSKLRQDLFYRIAHSRIHIPPLRSRQADIIEIAHYFLRQLSIREGLNVFDMEVPAEAELLNYAWPGNVRELAARIEDCAYRAQFESKTIITKDMLARSAQNQTAPLQKTNGLLQQLEEQRYQIVSEAVDRSGGNVAAAARSLGVDRMVVRNTLKKRVRYAM